MMEELPDRSVNLELNGISFRLVFDFNAICKTEEVLEENLLEPGKFKEKLGARRVRAMFWAAQLRYNKLTLEECGKLITLATMNAIMAAVDQAWIRSMGDDTETNSETGTEEKSVGPNFQGGRDGATFGRTPDAR